MKIQSKTITKIAKIWSIISILFILLMFIGNLFSSEETASFEPNELVAILFFPIGVVVGMIISWFKQLIGGVITVVSLLIFSFIMLFPNGMRIESLNFLVIAFPGVLFIWAGYLDKKSHS